MNDSITFTPALFARFKRAYAHAVKMKAETFMFQGREVLVAYAKYMIEYLEPRFK